MLPTVLILAILYFGLMELMLLESSEASRSASRFRSRVTAHAFAENAAELAAKRLVTSPGRTESLETSDGSMRATCRRFASDEFVIEAEGRTAGGFSVAATAKVWGHLENGRLVIDRTEHSQ